jgi:hypothetical protein
MAVIGSKRERLPNRRLPSTWRPMMSGEQRRTAHTDTAAKPVTVSKCDIFIARAWARATLFAAGEMTLHTAVDQLQQDAVASGLVAELGQDEIQHIMSAAFAPVRHDVGVTARDPIRSRSSVNQIRLAPLRATSFGGLTSGFQEHLKCQWYLGRIGCGISSHIQDIRLLRGPQCRTVTR